MKYPKLAFLVFVSTLGLSSTVMAYPPQCYDMCRHDIPPDFNYCGDVPCDTICYVGMQRTTMGEYSGGACYAELSTPPDQQQAAQAQDTALSSHEEGSVCSAR